MSMITETPAAANKEASTLFSRPSLLFALYTAIIPNLLFALASPFYIVSRLISPLLFLAAGVAGLFVPTPLTYILFFLAAAVDMTLIIMIAFHLPFDVALDSLKYAASIDPTASILYVSVGTTVTATTVLAGFLVSRHRGMLREASLVPALLIAGGLSAADYVWTQPYFEKPDVEIDSARIQTGMTEQAITKHGNNLLIVTVEGLGAFADPLERDIFRSILTKNLPEGRYRLEDGQTHYSGSTTGAAARELCGRWGDYIDYVTGAASFDCLPKKLAAAGYETTAFHGFGTDMFQRDKWYPQIGFQKLAFMDELETRRPDLFTRHCGSVFSGLCDADVGDAVHEALRASPDKRKFIYWLTLNSHIPFVKEENDRMRCRSDAPLVQDATVCELSNLWSIVFEKINAIAADPVLAATDILVVGDHHTPLWERAAKDRFVLGKVDWFLLRNQN
jgi:Sulfatase